MQDSALGFAASVLASAQAASDPGSAVLSPACHSDQYIDDADCSIPVSQFLSPVSASEEMCKMTEENLMSSIDLKKSIVLRSQA